MKTTIPNGSMVIILDGGCMPELRGQRGVVEGSYATYQGKYAPEINGVWVNVPTLGRRVRFECSALRVV